MSTDTLFNVRALRGDPDHDGYALRTVGGVPVWLPADLPAGGTTGQALLKQSDDDYDVDWETVAGSGGGVVLIENGDDPATYSPSVGDIIYQKKGVPVSTTWDFRGLSALPAGWARRGIASEVFDAAGMSAAYGGGQSHYYTVGAAPAVGLLEAKVVSAFVSGTMIGPQLYSSAITAGVGMAWYSSPSAALLLSINSSHQYGGSFANAGGTPTAPAWFRVRYAGSTSVFGSFSIDGTTWSAEVSLALNLGAINELSIGSLLGSATGKFEYVKWTPGATVPGGLLGWWDGSDVASFT